MDIIKTEIEGVDVVIENVKLNVRPTGAEDTSGHGGRLKMFEKAMDDMEPLIKGLARKGSGALNGIENRPDEMELAFSMGFSGEANAWVIKGSGELTFDVRMKWNSSMTENS